MKTEDKRCLIRLACIQLPWLALYLLFSLVSDHGIVTMTKYDRASLSLMHSGRTLMPEPERPVFDLKVVNVSGGRSSGMMLHMVLEEHGGLPDDHVAVFCNTGREHVETLDFVQEMSERWQTDIAWLEYVRRKEKPMHHYRTVDRDTASENGEPFDALISARNFLPNRARRLCTDTLKIKTTDRYIRRGLEHEGPYSNLLGLRYDEGHRWARKIREEGTEMPLVRRRTTARDVAKFWRRQPFDLQLDAEDSNCDFCFMKSASFLSAKARRYPELAQWWSAKEAQIGATFNKGYSYEDLIASDGQWAELPSAIDCHCTD